MLLSALNQRNLSCINVDKACRESLLEKSEIEEFGNTAQVETMEQKSEHEPSILIHRHLKLWGVRFLEELSRGFDDLFPDGLDSHVREQDNKDNDNGHRNYASSGGRVLGLSVVPDQLAWREEVNSSEDLAEDWRERGHALSMKNLNIVRFVLINDEK